MNLYRKLDALLSSLACVVDTKDNRIDWGKKDRLRTRKRASIRELAIAQIQSIRRSLDNMRLASISRRDKRCSLRVE